MKPVRFGAERIYLDIYMSSHRDLNIRYIGARIVFPLRGCDAKMPNGETAWAVETG
jgi:hypothetical protein